MDQKIQKDHPAIDLLTAWKKKIKMGVSDFEALSKLGTPEVATLKIDGEQTGIYLKDGDVQLVSRHGKIRTDLPVINELQSLLSKHKTALFVGELYVVDKSGNAIPYPKAITTLRNPKNSDDEKYIRMSIIDCIDLDGKTPANYAEAVEWINKIFVNGKLCHPVNVVDPNNLKQIWEQQILTNQYEGFVLHYHDKVVKVKPLLSFDLAVVFVEISEKHPDMAGALGLAFMDEAKIFRPAGKVGTGLSTQDRKEWLEWAKTNLKREDGRVLWVKPSRVVEVAAKGVNIRLSKTINDAMEVGEPQMTGILREPSLKSIREDKSITPEDLRMNQIPDWDNLGKKASWLSGDSMEVQSGFPNHPDTVIIKPNEYHPNGMTEQDIWEYYDGVADKIVPMLKGYEILIKTITPTGPVIIRHDPKTHAPISINTREMFDRFNNGRNVEFHRAVGPLTKLAWIDLDPHEGYDRNEIARAISFIKENVNNVIQTSGMDVVYSGGRGYHIHLKLNKPMNVDTARNTLFEWLNKEVVPNFPNTSAGIIKGDNTMRFDVSTLKSTGSLRSPLSLNATTGLAATLVSGDNSNEAMPKVGSFNIISYIVHIPGHTNSKGEPSPWVIKSHVTHKIIGSYTSRPAAEKALRMMHFFKHKASLKPAIPAEELAKKWKVSVDSINKVLDEGQKIEHEHTTSDKEARQIASHHIEEMLEYYDKLEKMEKKASGPDFGKAKKIQEIQVVLRTVKGADPIKLIEKLKQLGYTILSTSIYDRDCVLMLKPKLLDVRFEVMDLAARFKNWANITVLEYDKIEEGTDTPNDTK